MQFDTIIIRRSMLNEVYGARLWSEYRSCNVITTPDITRMDQELLTTITGKHIFIIGNYYSDHISEILDAASSVSIGYNAGEPTHEGVTAIVFHANMGFCRWTYDQLKIQTEYIQILCDLFDTWYYGSDIEKILSDVRTVVTKQKVDSAIEGKITIDGCEYTAKYNVADSFIIESASELALSSKSGIGILYGYNIGKNTTFVVVCTTEGSGISAGEIADVLFGGDGNYRLGHASTDGLFFPPNWK